MASFLHYIHEDYLLVLVVVTSVDQCRMMCWGCWSLVICVHPSGSSGSSAPGPTGWGRVLMKGCTISVEMLCYPMNKITHHLVAGCTVRVEVLCRPYIQRAVLMKVSILKWYNN